MIMFADKDPNFKWTLITFLSVKRIKDEVLV